MLIHSAPQDEAVLSNVGEIGEFRIRQSAKAFSILSSGLYANKIRAIIRELSCNAVDSHRAAGRDNTPFDVHLPSTLEPWFAVRDYGTGLDHNQVINLYTTYFESTKTQSNDFIGALGLGSKSPFSYTDNFTVTAVKDGRCGIYTAFINDKGVPSIALMSEDANSDLPNGVEVKLAVESRSDFYRFAEEAATVFQFFSLQPVVSGCSNFRVKTTEYYDQDLVPGISHVMGSRGSSYAIMGNIAYPIEVPNGEKVLGDLYPLLCLGLEIRFEIGDLDIQASREGLSYIPQTIEAIRCRLSQLQAHMQTQFAEEIKSYTTEWTRAQYAYTTARRSEYWRMAVVSYLNKNPNSLLRADHSSRYHYYILPNRMAITRAKLLEYNLIVDMYSYRESDQNIRLTRCGVDLSNVPFGIDVCTHFYINDIGRNAPSYLRENFKAVRQPCSPDMITVFTAADPSKPMLIDEFFKTIGEPDAPVLISTLTKPTPKKRAPTLERPYYRYVWAHRKNRFQWEKSNKFSKQDPAQTYYYVVIKRDGGEQLTQMSWLLERMKNILKDSSKILTIFGISPKDIDKVKDLPNWVLFDDLIRDAVSSISVEDLESTMFYAHYIDQVRALFEIYQNAEHQTTGTFGQLVACLHRMRNPSGAIVNVNSYCDLCRYLGMQIPVDYAVIQTKVDNILQELYTKYPLLKAAHPEQDTAISREFVEYIKLINAVKGE